jgi:hypothetical protein
VLFISFMHLAKAFGWHGKHSTSTVLKTDGFPTWDMTRPYELMLTFIEHFFSVHVDIHKDL